MKMLIRNRSSATIIAAALIFSLSTAASPIPLDFDKNAVQFIYSRTGTNFAPSGTCFLVKVSKTRWPKRPLHVVGCAEAILTLPVPLVSLFHFPTPYGGPLIQQMPYYVTAKHVLYDEQGAIRSNLFFRMTSATEGVTYFQLSDAISKGQLRVITHTNKAVDLVAVTETKSAFAPFTNKTQKPNVRVNWIDASLLADRSALQNRHIREGDDMFFVGLFTPFAGSSENVPICRFGHIAMLPKEPIMWAGGPLNLYLMDAECFGGNSGSPAFFHFPQAFRGKPYPFSNLFGKPMLVAGVVSGYFRDWSEVKIVNTGVAAYAQQNTGVTAVVPAYYLRDMILSDEEKAFMNDAFKAAFPKGF